MNKYQTNISLFLFHWILSGVNFFSIYIVIVFGRKIHDSDLFFSSYQLYNVNDTFKLNTVESFCYDFEFNELLDTTSIVDHSVFADTFTCI